MLHRLSLIGYVVFVIRFNEPSCAHYPPIFYYAQDRVHPLYLTSPKIGVIGGNRLGRWMGPGTHSDPVHTSSKNVANPVGTG